MRILLVEDDAESRELFAELLSERFEVSTASSGEAGLEAFRKLTPDVVVTDQALPGMFGTELAALVKADAPRTAVVLVTGYSRVEGADACDVVLEKPLDLDRLLTYLGELSRERSRDAW